MNEGEVTTGHEPFVRRAVELAILSGKKGNPTFGAVLVYEGEVIAVAENTEVTGDGYGHAEYNLAMEGARRFPDHVLQACTVYTSAPPCPRCVFSLLAVGIKRVVMSVSYQEFARLIPGDLHTLSMHEIVSRLGLTDVEIIGPVLEDAGMRAFQYWGGEYRPLEKLLDEARGAREEQRVSTRSTGSPLMTSS